VKMAEAGPKLYRDPLKNPCLETFHEEYLRFIEDVGKRGGEYRRNHLLKSSLQRGLVWGIWWSALRILGREHPDVRGFDKRLRAILQIEGREMRRRREREPRFRARLAELAAELHARQGLERKQDWSLRTKLMAARIDGVLWAAALMLGADDAAVSVLTRAANRS